jgi:glucosyl-3-phosphoglycerate phosphatase
MAERLIILRHGETDWNAQGRLNSWTDISLNEVGRNQARRAATALRHLRISSVLASPAARARQTIDEVLSSLSELEDFSPPTVNIDERLRELHFGPFESLTQHEIRAQGLTETFRVWRDETSQRSPVGAETFESAEERATTLMSDVVALVTPVVLLVSHGHFSRILLSHCVLGTSAEYHRRLRFDNGHLADIVIEEGKPRLTAFNTLELEPSKR